MRLRLEQLSFAYGQELVLNAINLNLGTSSVTALVGPNAAGKTTLLRCITGTLQPGGRILLGDRDLSRFNRKARARTIGYLAQEASSRAELTVIEAVLLGRLHTLGWRVSDDDLNAVYEMLETLGIASLALTSIHEISGGQRQMVSIAQVLVQQPRVLLMDEPTNNLDLQHQLEMLTLIKELTSQHDLVTLIALHDLNLAARYADDIVVLHQGQVYACGGPSAVLTSEMLRIVYGVHTRIDLGTNDLPVITLLRSVRTGFQTSGQSEEGGGAKANTDNRAPKPQSLC